MRTGVIGTGSIGFPLASNLLKQEKTMVAFDINPDATKPLAERQAQVVDSPVAVADSSDIVFACMPSIESFRAIVTGNDGVIHGKKIKTFVNLGTMGTEAVIDMEAALGEKGISTLDSPITGGVKRAYDADITVITSGPKAVYDQIEPLLKSFARDIHYIGERVGQAQIVKICNNIMSMTNMIIGCEAMVLAAKGGVDPEKALSVINSGSGQNSATLTKIPDFVMSRNFNMEAPMHILAKDAMLWRLESERLGVPHTVASAAYQTLQHGLAMGLKDGDFSEIVKLIERDANFELPKSPG